MSDNAVKAKVTVHKGITYPIGEYTSERVDYTIEAEVPANMTLPDFMNAVEAMVDTKLEEKRKTVISQGASAKTTPPKPSAAPPPKPALETLPWKAYPNGNGHWIPRATPGAEDLVAELDAAPGNVMTKGQYRYRLQGEGKFIARYPAGRRPNKVKT